MAVIFTPALIQLDVPLIAAHLVVFYAACLSNITPPVCVSAFAAAALAKADPMETGIAALKFGFALVFLPFGFVYLPPLLLEGSAFDKDKGLVKITSGGVKLHHYFFQTKGFIPESVRLE